jgi:REP element-mobilizing transposase RayT
MTDTLCWYNDYNLQSDIVINPKIKDFINKLSNKIEDKTIEIKINQIEKDYQNKLIEIEELCKKSNEIIILKSKSSLVILQKELDIIKLITKYTLQNKNINYDFIINCLNILLELSEILKNRLGQKDFNHDKMQVSADNTISRCSYKFCCYQDNCSYNYNFKIKNLCYQDHYVHNMVSADLKILINYVKNKYEDTKIVSHNKEILKTINTLSFVIDHMEKELRSKCMYIPESEWESCHILKNK